MYPYQKADKCTEKCVDAMSGPSKICRDTQLFRNTAIYLIRKSLVTGWYHEWALGTYHWVCWETTGPGSH